MKKVFPLLIIGLMLLTFASCERVGEPSPIKGVWEYELNGGLMTLEYGDRNVKYTCTTELLKSIVTYKGTYTISGNEIQHTFTSITAKNSSDSKIDYYTPEELSLKTAILKDSTTISYLDCIFKRKK